MANIKELHQFTKSEVKFFCKSPRASPKHETRTPKHAPRLIRPPTLHPINKRLRHRRVHRHHFVQFAVGHFELGLFGFHAREGVVETHAAAHHVEHAGLVAKEVPKVGGGFEVEVEAVVFVHGHFVLHIGGQHLADGGAVDGHHRDFVLHADERLVFAVPLDHVAAQQEAEFVVFFGQVHEVALELGHGLGAVFFVGDELAERGLVEGGLGGVDGARRVETGGFDVVDHQVEQALGEGHFHAGHELAGDHVAGGVGVGVVVGAQAARPLYFHVFEPAAEVERAFAEHRAQFVFKVHFGTALGGAVEFGRVAKDKAVGAGLVFEIALAVEDGAVHAGVGGREDARVHAAHFFGQVETGDQGVAFLVFGVFDADDGFVFVHVGVDHKPAAADDRVGVEFGEAFKAQVLFVGAEADFALVQGFGVHAELGGVGGGAFGGGQHVFGGGGAGAAALAHDVAEENLLFEAAGQVVLVKTGGFVEFFAPDFHLGPVDGVVFVDGVRHDADVVQLVHFTALLDADIAAVGVDVGVGRFDVVHAADLQLVGFHVVEGRFALEGQGVAVFVGGDKEARLFFVGFEGDGLFLHVPGKLVHGGAVPVEGHGGGGHLGVGLELAFLVVEVQFAVDVFGFEGDALAGKGFDFQVGRVGTGLEGAVGDDFGREFAAVPFKHAAAFEALGRQGKAALVGVAGGFEEFEGFLFAVHVQGVLEGQPVDGHVFALGLRGGDGGGAVFAHEEFFGGADRLFGFKHQVFRFHFGGQVFQFALTNEALVAQVEGAGEPAFVAVGLVAFFRGFVHEAKGFVLVAHLDDLLKIGEDGGGEHFAPKFQLVFGVVVEGVEGKGIKFEIKRVPLVGPVLGFLAVVIDEGVLFGLQGGENRQVVAARFVVLGVDEDHAAQPLDGGVHGSGPGLPVFVFDARGQVKVEVLHRVEVDLELGVVEVQVFAFDEHEAGEQAAGEAHVAVLQQGHVAAVGDERRALFGTEFYFAHLVDLRFFGFEVEFGIGLAAGGLDADVVKVFFVLAGQGVVFELGSNPNFVFVKIVVDEAVGGHGGQQALDVGIVEFGVDFFGKTVVGHHVGACFQMQEVEGGNGVLAGERLHFVVFARVEVFVAFKLHGLFHPFGRVGARADLQGVAHEVPGHLVGGQVHLVKRGVERVAFGAFDAPGEVDDGPRFRFVLVQFDAEVYGGVVEGILAHQQVGAHPFGHHALAAFDDEQVGGPVEHLLSAVVKNGQLGGFVVDAITIQRAAGQPETADVFDPFPDFGNFQTFIKRFEAREGRGALGVHKNVVFQSARYGFGAKIQGIKQVGRIAVEQRFGDLHAVGGQLGLHGGIEARARPVDGAALALPFAFVGQVGAAGVVDDDGILFAFADEVYAHALHQRFVVFIAEFKFAALDEPAGRAAFPDAEGTLLHKIGGKLHKLPDGPGFAFGQSHERFFGQAVPAAEQGSVRRGFGGRHGVDVIFEIREGPQFLVARHQVGHGHDAFQVRLRKNAGLVQFAEHGEALLHVRAFGGRHKDPQFLDKFSGFVGEFGRRCGGRGRGRRGGGLRRWRRGAGIGRLGKGDAGGQDQAQEQENEERAEGSVCLLHRRIGCEVVARLQGYKVAGLCTK